VHVQPVLTTLATAVTRNRWPVSISRTAKACPGLAARIRLPYPVVTRVVNGGPNLETGGGITLAVLSAHANFAFIPYPFWVLLVIAWASSSSGRWPPTAASSRPTAPEYRE
jgi:hypothetical protein